jgi:hypothetical protein
MGTAFVLLGGTFRYQSIWNEAHHSVRVFRVPSVDSQLACRAPAKG